jgi:hypothetical protein
VHDLQAKWLRASLSLTHEPGCGQSESSSTHTTMLFYSFSPLRQVEFIFVFDMV